MSTGVRVLCRPEVAPGFELAGLTVDVLAPDGDLPHVLGALLDRKDVGVLLMEDRIYRDLPEELRRRADRSATPVVVPFPSPQWEKAPPAEQYVVELLHRAIGYRVRLG
jgi:vacuolar-type H+-ATPase subunit F/Vma7